MKTAATSTGSRLRRGPAEPPALTVPAGRVAAPLGGRELHGGGRLLRGWPIVSPFGDLAALAARRDELEEEILEFWEG